MDAVPSAETVRHGAQTPPSTPTRCRPEQAPASEIPELLRPGSSQSDSRTSIVPTMTERLSWEITTPLPYLKGYQRQGSATEGYDELGRGAWSTVYCATEGFKVQPSPLPTPPTSPTSSPGKPVIDRLLAIKTAARRDGQKILYQEARVLTYLHSSPEASRFLVPFHGYDQASQSLVMDAVPLNLDTYARSCLEEARLNFSTRTMFDPVCGTSVWQSLATQLTNGLAFLHEASCIHGDIKPANVLLRPNGADLGEGFTALYCDFSSSCILDGPSGEDSEQSQQLTAVTADFASPELLSSLSNISALATTASDIYALAVTLAVAATGSSPYAGASMELHKLGMIREGRVLDFARLGEQGTRVMKGRLVERSPELKATKSGRRNSVDVMSFASVNDPHPESTSAVLPNEYPAKPSYKSFRKKYLKKRHGFKEKYRESNTLFEDEQRTTRIANRLLEQNDQLLDLLLDLNESKRIPAPLRYALSPTPSPSAVPSLEPDDPHPSSILQAAQSAASKLNHAYNLLSSGQISPARFSEISTQLEPILRNPTPLTTLFARTPHTTRESIPSDTLEHDFAPTDTTFLTSTHEDAYLNVLDAAISSSHSDTDAAVAALKKDAVPSVKDVHKDLSVRNPVSAYNWLRKHKPELFASMQLNDLSGIAGETGQERKPKPSPKPNTSHPGGGGSGSRGGGGNGKREKKSEVNLKPEPEMLDEEGNVIGGTAEGAPAPGTLPAKGGKRKRGEDDAYRPKGGSSRPGKRKRAGTGSGRGGRGTAGAEEGVT
ncbi:MAG: hypothetical protein LQ345_000270 [Seirophora villosa]|nr:MAG: hypothetical protein LQ345_000270 [Seirophora villosa]